MHACTFIPEYVLSPLHAREVKDRWAHMQWKQLMLKDARADALEEGALILSQWSCTTLDVANIRLQLGTLAAQGGAVKDRPLCERIEAVNAALREFGLKANTEDYYNEGNSMLHRILEEKRGIPISMCLLWAMIAARAEIKCHLCAQMPQHVIVCIDAETFVDVFEGKVMNRSDLQGMCTMRGFAFHESFIQECTAAQVYQRIMRNLLNIYEGKGDLDKLMGGLLQAAAIAPNSVNPQALFELNEKCGRRPIDTLLAERPDVSMA